MAKPIRATPTLSGEDCKRFVRAIIKEEKNPSRTRINFIKKATKIKFNIC